MNFRKTIHKVCVGTIAASVCLGGTAVLPALTTGSSVVFAAYENVWLTVGSVGQDVYYVQQILYSLGIRTVAPDGEFGTLTESDVRTFQAAYGQAVDGIVGPATMNALVAAAGGTSTTAQASSTSTSTTETSTTNVAASGVLSQGSTGNSVKILQQMLIDLGYNCGGADGSFGSATASALVAYQQDNGLYADAIAGPVTLDALQKSWAARGTATQAVSTQAPAAAVSAGTMLSTGSTGAAVFDLQQRLVALGFNCGGVDGYYGSVTANAVAAFQTNAGLYVDGIAGPVTLNALYARTAASANASANSQAASTASAGQQLAVDKLNEIGWDLKTAYDWVVSTGYDTAYTGATTDVAAQALFENGSGDCVARAAGFCLMARALGYDCKVVVGQVPYTNGTLAEHGWTEISANGGTYVCDPDYEWDTKNSGYMITYGQSGTWVYQNNTYYPE